MTAQQRPPLPVIEITEQIVPAAEHIVPALSQHTLILCAGNPLKMAQMRDGKSNQRKLNTHDLIIAPAWIDSACNWSVELHMLHVRIPDQAIQKAFASMQQRGSQVEIINNFGTSDPLLVQLLATMHAENQNRGWGTALFLESLTTALCVHLIRNYSSQKARLNEPVASRALSDAGFRCAVEFMHENMHTEVGLKEVASIASVSLFHFAREFKKRTGLAPHQYLIQIRLERAIHLLISSELPVAGIAEQTGFFDVSHLARHTHRRYGYAPLEIRNNSKNILISSKNIMPSEEPE